MQVMPSAAARARGPLGNAVSPWRHTVIRASAGRSSAQAAFQQAKADHDFTGQELELKLNIQLTREIDQLATELHNRCAR